MNTGKTLFAQVMDFLPWKTFHRIVARHGRDKSVRALTCAEPWRGAAPRFSSAPPVAPSPAQATSPMQATDGHPARSCSGQQHRMVEAAAGVAQARMSSALRSGSSSSTCSGVSPFASRSSTSETRMRMPRMHGRPPHCSGSMMMCCDKLMFSSSEWDTCFTRSRGYALPPPSHCRRMEIQRIGNPENATTSWPSRLAGIRASPACGGRRAAGAVRVDTATPPAATQIPPVMATSKSPSRG